MKRVWLPQAGLHWPEIQRGFPLELWRDSLSASWGRSGKMLSAEHTYSIFSSSWLQAREHKWQCIINCCSSGFLPVWEFPEKWVKLSGFYQLPCLFPQRYLGSWSCPCLAESGRRAMVALQSFLTKVLCLFLSMCWFLGPVITVSTAFTAYLWNNVWNEVFWVEAL